MKRVLLEGLQPKEKGLTFSWFKFKNGKLTMPSLIEKALDLTIPLTDIITNFYSISIGMDSNSEINIINQKGLLEPNFTIQIKGKDFEIEANKYFAGGSNRSNCFNFKIDVILYSPLRERILQIISSYKKYGSLPLYFFSDV